MAKPLANTHAQVDASKMKGNHMIKCSIMNGAAYAPAYITGTKRVASVPNMEEVRLLTTVDLKTTMEVLVYDNVVETRELDPGRRHFLNLALFLDRAKGQEAKPAANEPATIWDRLRRSQATGATSEPVKEFTIQYRNTDKGGEVVATFDFQVKDPVSFKLGKLAHSVQHDPTAHESDANPNSPKWDCWNCDSVAKNRRTTCDNCGAPRNHPKSLKLHD